MNTAIDGIRSVAAFQKPLVILESPYSGEIDTNTLYARRCLSDCVHRGEAPIASHLLFTQPGVLRDHDPAERQLGIDCGLAWIRRADYSVFYTDRGWSPGMLSALYEFGIKRNYLFRLRSLGSSVVLPGRDCATPLPWLNEEILSFLASRIDGEHLCR